MAPLARASGRRVVADMIFAIAVLLAAYALIGPRKMFWSLQAWAYQDPDSHEPSVAFDHAGRAVAAIAAFVVLMTGIMNATSPSEPTGPWNGRGVDATDSPMGSRTNENTDPQADGGHQLRSPATALS